MNFMQVQLLLNQAVFTSLVLKLFCTVVPILQIYENNYNHEKSEKKLLTLG